MGCERAATRRSRLGHTRGQGGDTKGRGGDTKGRGGRRGRAQKKMYLHTNCYFGSELLLDSGHSILQKGSAYCLQNVTHTAGGYFCNAMVCTISVNKMMQ